MKSIINTTATKQWIGKDKTVDADFSNGDQVIAPDAGALLKDVTVKKPTTLEPYNIRQGIMVAGIEGNLAPDKPDQTKTVSPSTSEQVIVADTGYELGSVTIEAVTNEIDKNITADNIKKGVSILGVTGNVVPSDTDMLQARVDETKDCSYLFYYYTGTNPDIVKNLDTSNVTSMRAMFNSCSKLTSLDLSRFNTSNVTEMSAMFYSCQNLTSLDLSNFVTSSVTDMSAMFNTCSRLTSLDLSSFDTSSVKFMTQMFYYCPRLTSLDLSNFNTSNVTSMSNMFYYCSSLTTLNLSSFDTSSVTDMRAMFNSCSKLTSLDLSRFNTSNVTEMSAMFYSCQNLTSLDLSNFVTSSVTSMAQMFYNCKSLQNIIGTLDLIKCTNLTNMFNNCTKLTTLPTMTNIKVNLSLSYCTLLTAEEIETKVLNGLYDLTGQTAKTLTLGTTLLGKLSDEQKAIATNKNWILA